LNRNTLYFVIGALVVAVAILGYTTWQDRKQPEGLQISIGKQGVDVRNK
jgi:hypothetical protein